MKGIGLGTWAWGNQLLWGYRPEQDDLLLKETFKTAINGGLNFIDTADSYGTGSLNGRSEKLIGQFLKEIPENKIRSLIIGTKLAPFPWRLGRKGFTKAFKSSQKRLSNKLDRVQLHWSTYRYAPWQEGPLLDGLCDLIDEGVVKDIGVSNVGNKRLKWMHSRLLQRGIELKSLQVQFSLLAPQLLFNPELTETCKELNIEILAYSPLAFGLLAKGPSTSERPATFLRKEIFKRVSTRSQDLRKGVFEIARDRQATPSQVALNWCRSHNTQPIPGLRTPAQAKEAIQAMKWVLSKKEKQKLDSLCFDNQGLMPINPFQSN